MPFSGAPLSPRQPETSAPPLPTTVATMPPPSRRPMARTLIGRTRLELAAFTVVLTVVNPVTVSVRGGLLAAVLAGVNLGDDGR